MSDISELSTEQVLDFIPKEIKLFMSALTGDSRNDINGVALSIAQDLMMYIKPKIRTPKAVCLGVFVKTMTNSKAVIDHLHKLGHSLSYKDILAIDTNLAKQILDDASKVGMVVPPNLRHRNTGGGLLQAAADNIDFSEETIDGKNTTHATSAVIYQTNKGTFTNFSRSAFVKI